MRQLIAAGFKPVVFCRYIATAHYVGGELKSALPPRRTHIEVVTGELTPDQREERVEAFRDLEQAVTPVLVATDCLSEGVNLQDHFDAVVHYDLTWNPTRHEQREGRADRFGQASRTVRTLMLYGEDNPVDGAVLRVILRKAERIRRELGVAVPLPADSGKVVEAIMRTVLLQRSDAPNAGQMDFDFGKTEARVDNAWKTARNRMTRTVFAQRRLRPAEVLPEWHKSVSALGGRDDVARFVSVAAERLGAGLDRHDGYSRLPVAHFPKPLQDRLDAIGFKPTSRITFDLPAPPGAVHIHRAHPLVTVLADYVAEQALDIDDPEIGARSGAVFTKDVDTRTVLFLLRLRSQIQVQRRDATGRYAPVKSLLAEECIATAHQGGDTPEQLSEVDALSLLAAEPGRNMADGQKTHMISQALGSIRYMEPVFERIARERARRLLEDHRRIREASRASGLRYQVTPALPVDKIGVYVLMPMTSL